MAFSAAAQAQNEGRIVRRSYLFEWQFASETLRSWTGFGDLKTLDNRVWKGTGNVITAAPLQQSVDGTAPPIEITLSGLDANFAAKAKAEAAEYFNRPLLIFIQYFDEDWQCLDMPYARAMGRMQTLTPRKRQEDGKVIRDIVLTAETPFASRKRPPFAFLTDRDQQQRFPGDQGLERKAGLRNKVIKFPA